MAQRQRRSEDQDSPWKDALERFLKHCLQLLFPLVHDGIDWRRGYQSLDKEFQQIAHDAPTGRRLADKLFRVWLKDGRQFWLLIHLEVQGHKDATFGERMFIYGYRAYDLHEHPVVSLAILCDDDPAWRPTHFEVGRFGSRLRIDFLAAKLLEYRDREAELLASSNPLAAVVLAQLKVLETRSNPQARLRWKLQLVQGLYDRGLSQGEVHELFRLLDWLVQLPKEFQQTFWQDIHAFEEERRMPYVTSIERMARKEGRKEGRQLGRKEGRKEGKQEGIIEGLQMAITALLQTKYGAAGMRLLPKVQTVQEVEQLRALTRAVHGANTLEEVKQLIESARA